MKTSTKRRISIALMLGLLVTLLLCVSGCENNKDDYQPISGLDRSKPVTLKIAIPYETSKALNEVANAFMKRYSNVTVLLEHIDDYDTNAEKLFKENELDMFFQKDLTYGEYTKTDEATGETVPSGKNSDDYYYNFAADTEIDFSDTTPDITDN